MSAIKFLHDLIHSLDKGEKRFFRLFTGLYNNKQAKQYITLYDILLKTKEFNEQSVNKKIYNQLPENKISQIQANLKEKILESLIFFHKNNLPVLKHISNVHKANLLTKKKHYVEAKKILEKEKKEMEKRAYYALSYYLHTDSIALDGLFEHRNIHFFDKVTTSYDSVLNDLKRLEELVKAKLIHNEIRKCVYSKYTMTSSELEENVKHIYQTKLQRKQIDGLEGIEAKYYCFQSLYLCCELLELGDAKKMDSLEQAITLVKKYPYLFAENIAYPSLVNIMRLYVGSAAHEKFSEAMVELSKLIKKADDFSKPKMLYWKYVRLLEYHSSFAKELSEEYIKEIMEYLQQTTGLSDEQKIGVSFKLANVFFELGKYEKSQEILQEIVVMAIIQENDFYYISTRIMYILNCYEFGEIDLAIREMRSIRRKLKRENFTSASLNDLMDIINTIISNKANNINKTKLKLNEIIFLFEVNKQDIIFIIKLFFIKKWAEQKLTKMSS